MFTTNKVLNTSRSTIKVPPIHIQYRKHSLVCNISTRKSEGWAVPHVDNIAEYVEEREEEESKGRHHQYEWQWPVGVWGVCGGCMCVCGVGVVWWVGGGVDNTPLSYTFKHISASSSQAIIPSS